MRRRRTVHAAVAIAMVVTACGAIEEADPPPTATGLDVPAVQTTSSVEELPPLPDLRPECTTTSTTYRQGSIPDGATGFATPEAAIEDLFAEHRARYGGEIVVDGSAGLLIIEDLRVGVAQVSETDVGGWFVTFSSVCPDYRLLP